MSKSNKQQVPKIRFEGFSDKWNEVVISELLTINSGRDYKHLGEGDIPVYGTGGYMLSVDEYLSDKDSIGIGRKGTIDKPQLLRAPFWTVDTLFHLAPKRNIDLIFSYNLLQRINWLRYDESTGVPSLSKATIEKIKSSRPELEEQTQIGNFFQQLDKLIELQTRAVESAETYKKAMLQKMFPQKGEKVPRVRFAGFSGDWNEKVIGDIAKIKRGASPRPISDPKWFDNSSSIGWVRISDVTRSFRILEETEQYLSELGVKKSRLIKSGSIIMSICATIGKPVYTAFDVCIHDGFVVFDDLKIDEGYTLYFLQTIQEKWYQYGQPGTQVNLNSDIVSQEKIVYPSLDEQIQISNYFQKLDQNIESEKKKLEQYQTMKRAMLQRMFV